MLYNVQPGDRILASQYNALVDAARGPGDPSSETPFTQTYNGALFNGGKQYTPKTPCNYNAVFNINAGIGEIDREVFTDS